MLERAGAAVILPALPGSGKSTLTAALAASGFRLLSDEFGVVRLGDGLCLPMVRPTALKNESIDVISRLRPGLVMGPVFRGTRKGDVAHLAPEAESVDKRHAPAPGRYIVFPQFEAGASTDLEPIARARAFAKLAVNSFNYEVLGAAGFEAVARLIARCDCYRLRYGEIREAIAVFEALLSRSPGRRSAEPREAGGLAAV